MLTKPAILLSKKPVPQKHNLIPEIRKEQKNFKRIMYKLYKYFLTSFKSFFIYTFDSVCKNAKAVLVIKKNTGRKAVTTFVGPAVFIFNTFAYKNQGRLGFKDGLNSQ